MGNLYLFHLKQFKGNIFYNIVPPTRCQNGKLFIQPVNIDNRIHVTDSWLIFDATLANI